MGTANPNPDFQTVCRRPLTFHIHVCSLVRVFAEQVHLFKHNTQAWTIMLEEVNSEEARYVTDMHLDMYTGMFCVFIVYKSQSIVLKVQIGQVVISTKECYK